MDFQSAVELSAKGYVAALEERMARSVPSSLTGLARCIAETTSAALAHGQNMTVEQVSLTVEQTEAVLREHPEQSVSLANEFSLGLGTPQPVAVFLGKEPAYDPTLPINFHLESLALTALWLTHGKQAILEKMIGRSPLATTFLREPASLAAGNYSLASAKQGHTWNKVAKLMSFRLRQPVSATTWGKHAFMADLNAIPSRTHRNLAPSPSRVAFLEVLVRSLAEGGARTLVLHSQEPHHEAAQEQLILAFLNVSTLPAMGAPRKGATRSETVETWDHLDRRVLRCRHLSNSISDVHLEDIGALVL